MFGRSNGSKAYKLQRVIIHYKQGNQSVLIYFNNLTALWNELDLLLPPMDCVCRAKWAYSVREEQQRLVQFLEGLDNYFEQVRQQSF